MDKQYEITYHELEEKHWWFFARRDAIFKLVSQLDRKSRILDIGCSSGILINQLITSGFKNIYGIDFSLEAIQLCKKRNLPNVLRMDGQFPSFADETFDLIIASDSLEHLPFDETALLQWHRILKPAGKLLLFVPAHPFLWSSHDEINHHYRRYTRNDLIKKIHNAGFQINRISFWNFLLFFPTAIIRIFRRLIGRRHVITDDLKISNRFFNQQLILLLKLENRILKFFNLPIGVSLCILARKSE